MKGIWKLCLLFLQLFCKSTIIPRKKISKGKKRIPDSSLICWDHRSSRLKGHTTRSTVPNGVVKLTSPAYSSLCCLNCQHHWHWFTQREPWSLLPWEWSLVAVVTDSRKNSLSSCFVSIAFYSKYGICMWLVNVRSYAYILLRKTGKVSVWPFISLSNDE